MNRAGKKILAFIIIIFAIVQSLIIYEINNVNEMNRAKMCINQSNIKTYKTLSEFKEELNCSKENYVDEEKYVKEAILIDGQWYIKLKIKGNKDYILNELSKLKGYKISDYEITHDNKEDSIVIEISDSNPL